MISEEKKKLIDSMPFYSAVFDEAQKFVYGNKLWNKLGQENSISALSGEKIFRDNGLSEIIKKVFNGEINYITKPLFCDSGSLSFTNSFENKLLKFVLFPEKVDEHFLVYVLIELTESEISEKSHSQDKANRDSVINVLKILEAERERISSDLHDEVVQNLLVAKLELDLFLREKKNEDEKINFAVESINMAIGDIRNLIQSMHPALIKKNGLIKAIEMLITRYKLSSKVDILVNIFGQYRFSSPIIEINIYRILQEALSNIKKHAAAKKVSLELHFTENMIIGSIIDDGKGFDIENALSDVGSFGLISMKERIRSVQGELFVESDKKGTKIIFHIPVRCNDE